MIQLNNLEEIGANDIPDLVTLITPILNKRDELYNDYYRRDADSNTLYSTNDENIKVALETYIADVAAGYFGGKEPKYIPNEQLDKEKQNIITKTFNKIFNVKSYKKEMEVLINYITNYNDDSTEHMELVRDYMIKGACYELIYENMDNEIVYSRLDALQTVAIYNYEVPSKMVGLVRIWDEKNSKGTSTKMVEITDINGTRYYNGNKSYEECVDKFKENKWGEVPAIAMEQPDGMSVFETVISLIFAYQRVIQNSRNTFQYNDEAKLKVTGYQPTNNLTIVNDEGTEVENPDRVLEDKLFLESKVFYTPDANGDIEWIEKTVQDGALDNHKKTLIDLIAMISGVPNITDLGFTNADNASAIDRKFFVLEQKVALADKLFKKEYLKRWELIFNRINLKKNSKFDYRDIKVKLYRNLPTDKYTETDNALKLRGLLSDETIIGMLPNELDPISELSKIDAETDEVIVRNEEKEIEKKIEIENNTEELENEE